MAGHVVKKLGPRTLVLRINDLGFQLLGNTDRGIVEFVNDGTGNAGNG